MGLAGSVGVEVWAEILSENEPRCLAKDGTDRHILARKNLEMQGMMVFLKTTVRSTKPAGLPVEQVSKFDVVLNFKALGLTIPQSVLVRADEGIQ